MMKPLKVCGSFIEDSSCEKKLFTENTAKKFSREMLKTKKSQGIHVSRFGFRDFGDYYVATFI